MEEHKTNLILNPIPPFDFGLTAHSHGWVALTPNRWIDDRRAVQRTQRLESGKVVCLDISGNGAVDSPQITIKVSHAAELSEVECQEIQRAVGHMFRLDENLSEFYALCRQRGSQWERLTAGLGRLLRSPGLFEDVVKTILTTNIQWGGTRRMVNEVVAAYGEAYPGDPARKAFPTPQAIASVPLEDFLNQVHLGYRGEFIHLLAQRVAQGDLDLESFADPTVSTPDLKKKLLAIKGVGNYAAATLLMLLGRYDELAVDTAFRQVVRKKYFDNQPVSDAQAKTVYDDWGKWKYLAYWFDIWQGYNENP